MSRPLTAAVGNRPPARRTFGALSRAWRRWRCFILADTHGAVLSVQPRGPCPAGARRGRRTSAGCCAPEPEPEPESEVEPQPQPQLSLESEAQPQHAATRRCAGPPTRGSACSWLPVTVVSYGGVRGYEGYMYDRVRNRRCLRAYVQWTVGRTRTAGELRSDHTNT
jgi:hypothetical protein